jgi:hypothetical protein
MVEKEVETLALLSVLIPQQGGAAHRFEEFGSCDVQASVAEMCVYLNLGTRLMPNQDTSAYWREFRKLEVKTKRAGAEIPQFRRSFTITDYY